MAWPLPRKFNITTPYGVTGSAWKACGRHTGADFAAPAGTPLYAAIAGTIRHRNYGSAFGRYQFAISPSAGQPFASDEVFYAHCASRLPDGTEVQVGDKVGTVGYEGNVYPPGPQGAHLHFEFHAGKNTWNCGVMRNPQSVLDHGGSVAPPPSSGWMFPAGQKVYQKFLRVDGHELNSDRVSDSIKALQEMLNRHSMPGGANIDVTGKYWTQTDTEVRLCQSLHLPPADPQMKSYVGPKQFEHLKAATGAPYEFVPGDNSVPITPPPTSPPPAVKWFVPPSINKLLSEVNEKWPGRDKSSDGTIGDYEHSRSQSEHNPVGHEFGPEFGTPGAVHAVDITADNPALVGAVMRAAIGDARVWYVIHNRFIYSKTYDWAERPYNGSNPHTSHVHISLKADDKDAALFAENDTSQWLRDDVAPVDPPPSDGVVAKSELRAWLDEGYQRFNL